MTDPRGLALLVGRAQCGDRRALDDVLRALQAPLWAHVRAMLRDDAAAEEVLQDALLQVARRLPSLREPRWLRAWAYRIATRLAARRARRDRPWREALSAFGAGDLAALAAPAEEPRFDPALVAALPAHVDALSPASAVVLRMHYLEELTYAEIAEALEISVGTVKSRLAYGLASLRRRLDAVGEPASSASIAATPAGR